MSLSRRELLGYSATFGSAFLAAQGLCGAGDEQQEEKTQRPKPLAGKRYEMKKSINLWALPYPQKMTLKECFQLCKDAGFDGVEVNYALEGDLSPEASEAAIRVANGRDFIENSNVKFVKSSPPRRRAPLDGSARLPAAPAFAGATAFVPCRTLRRKPSAGGRNRHDRQKKRAPGSPRAGRPLASLIADDQAL